MKSNESKLGEKQAFQFLKAVKVLKLLPHSNLVEQLKKIDVEPVHEIVPGYLEGLETENPVNGAHRDLRHIPSNACQILSSENRKESLKGLAGTFQIALGGDGCPFGKNESTCSFLVSFLNVGRRGWCPFMITF